MRLGPYEAGHVHLCDCLEGMKALPENSIDTICTDPPYGLGFMGKEWDTPGAFVERKSRKRAGSFESVQGNHNPVDAKDRQRTRLSEGRRFQSFMEEWAVEVLRVAKPGATLLVFGGTRTFHRLACAIEDAGWEIRDTVMWVYGSGFPKSFDISKAIDKAAGAEREVVGHYESPEGTTGWKGQDRRGCYSGPSQHVDGERRDISAPSTPLAKQWDGWGHGPQTGMGADPRGDETAGWDVCGERGKVGSRGFEYFQRKGRGDRPEDYAGGIFPNIWRRKRTMSEWPARE